MGMGVGVDIKKTAERMLLQAQRELRDGIMKLGDAVAALTGPEHTEEAGLLAEVEQARLKIDALIDALLEAARLLV